MAIRRYLAMTGAELRGASAPIPGIAWMACHFSPYGLRASNLPRALPSGSLLILDDITPIAGHDPAQIAFQLGQCLAQLECAGLLLDFQRPGYPEAASLAQFLSEQLPCPVAVSALYAENTGGPVFLPPVPHDLPIEAHLAPWQSREVWLDMALDAAVLTLTEDGSSTLPLPSGQPPAPGFTDETLHCHYQTALTADSAQFTFWRTPEDLDALLEEAEALGVTTAVGLYQELGHSAGAPKLPDS